MSVKINVALSAEANLLALILDANPQASFDVGDLSFGAPSVLTDHPTGKNTSLVVSPTANLAGVAGSVTVTYNRLGMGAGVAVPNFSYTLTDPEITTAEFLTQVASDLGLREEEVEFDGEVVVPEEGNTSTITLRARSGSLLYVGEQVINITWSFSLEDMITNLDLSGFDPAE